MEAHTALYKPGTATAGTEASESWEGVGEDAHRNTTAIIDVMTRLATVQKADKALHLRGQGSM